MYVSFSSILTSPSPKTKDQIRKSPKLGVEFVKYLKVSIRRQKYNFPIVIIVIDKD